MHAKRIDQCMQQTGFLLETRDVSLFRNDPDTILGHGTCCDQKVQKWPRVHKNFGILNTCVCVCVCVHG